MFNNKKYITRGIEATISPELQQYLWGLINDLGIEKDYLQVFDLKSECVPDKGQIQKIIHKQEVPEYKKEHVLIGIEPVNCKIFVIDDETHSTMLLAEEY